jgi:DNA-binding PadR family transcriptional regulator
MFVNEYLSMTKRDPSPLALATLALLLEKPMHPYELGYTMKMRHLEDSIKLRYGSLYQTVESLERSGAIQATRTERAGQRPERTVYAITDTGRDEFLSSLRELARRHTPDYSLLETALCFIGYLPPYEAADLLDERAAAMQVDLDLQQATLTSLLEAGLLRIHLVEIELRIARRESELRWLRGLIDDIRSARIEWPAAGGTDVSFVRLVPGESRARAVRHAR